MGARHAIERQRGFFFQKRDDADRRLLHQRPIVRPARIQRIVDGHKEAYLRRAPNIQALPGARDLLAALTDAGVPWAIATSSHMDTAGPTLALIGVDAARAAVITRGEVEHAKPDPDLFLAAAARISMPIGDSTVVGDAVVAWSLWQASLRHRRVVL